MLCLLQSKLFGTQPVLFRFAYENPVSTLPVNEIKKVYSRRSGYYENTRLGKKNYLLQPVLKGEISVNLINESAPVPALYGTVMVKTARLVIVRGEKSKELFYSYRDFLPEFVNDCPEIISELKNSDESLSKDDVIRMAIEYNAWYAARNKIPENSEVIENHQENSGFYP